ncbi:MAG: SUMF1/EgtB/PvdO family nonheme iron enzyme [Candidatus Aminicenantes bacterium]|nr:SUMF1/EgtB/PvdO family nonheme iron enzyme [Candidatus Aminicenantes bacterium]
MKIHNWQKRVAIVVLLAFIGMGVAWTAEQTVPQFQEKEGAPIIKKHKRFPWLPVLLGAGAVISAVVLLTKKNDNNPSAQMTGSLHVTSLPAGARLYLDGKDTGKTSDITMDQVKIGTHIVRLTFTSFIDFTTSIVVVEGQSATINAVMTANLDFDMVAIPGGTFEMGSTGSEAYPDERPVHAVAISPFQIGKYEVTQGQWKAVMGSNPSAYPNGDDYPVETVSWNDAQAFIQKVYAMTGRRYRLPTEAEWEYACRAGTTAERYDDSDAIAWYSGNSGFQSHPVRQKQPNSFGLYDMLGNVSESCRDWYGPYPSTAQNDPGGPASGTHYVRRGGSFNSAADCIRAARRNYGLADFRSAGLGFRLARTNE